MTAAADLHGDSDGLSLGQYLGEVLGAENVAQRGLGTQPGRDHAPDTQTDAPDRLHYPSTLRSVVCASKRVEWCAFSTRCCPVVGQFEEW